MNTNERFEYMAAKFYKETGIMAPGKDDCLMSHTDEERSAAWSKWLEVFYSELFDRDSKAQCLASVKVNAVAEFCKSGVSPNSKAGCIGEFSVSTEQTCPECWQEQDGECELCHGESDENGVSDLDVDIPWTTQKDIFARMLEFKHEHYLRKAKS